jgi:uncharacterized protein YjcR
MVTKLNKAQATEIYFSEKHNSVLAKKHNVSISTIRRIKNGQSWKSISRPNGNVYKQGRPHQTSRMRNKAWCPYGCGKCVSGKYHKSLYYYQCERCGELFEEKPK